MKLFILLSIILFVSIAMLVYQEQSYSNNNPPIFVEKNNYIPYTESRLQNAIKDNRVVLFFAATSWCTTCSELDKKIIENNQNIPSDVVILQVDYDHDVKTRNKYAVTMQTTLILLDHNGNEVKRWISGDFDRLIAELQS